MNGNSLRRLLSDKGFSIVELCISLSVAVIILGFALLNMMEIRRGMNANKAMYQIVDQLRNGRELAIAQRRVIELQFPSGDNQIQLIRHNLSDETTDLVGNVILPNSCKFMLFELPDSPDRLGNSDAISFQDTNKLAFLPDGTLVGDDNNPRSGSFFFGEENHPETARAVTIIGPTGRIRSYRWNGTDWIQ